MDYGQGTRISIWPSAKDLVGRPVYIGNDHRRSVGVVEKVERVEATPDREAAVAITMRIHDYEGDPPGGFSIAFKDGQARSVSADG